MILNKKTLRIFSVNILLFFSLIGTIEILFGNWRRNFFSNNYVQIPGLVKNLTLKYDGRWMYYSNKPLPIIYFRDHLGYRSKDIKSNKLKVLTIGGSLTDNRFITEGETWQDVLDRKIPKYDFINGGVDGQSSFGHSLSLAAWHSKALDPESVKFIIFYIGVNETRLLNNKFNNNDFPQTKKKYLKNVLKDNSFFVNRLLVLKNRISFILDSKRNNYKILQHSKKSLKFREKSVEYKISDNFDLSSYQEYVDIFANLLIQTQKYFPDTKILIIQQQIPICKFKNKSIVLNIHPDKNSRFCEDLMKVYAIQEEIIKSNFFNEKKVKNYPMFLNSYLSEEDVYDYWHLNKYGSNKIAEYIEMIKILH